jgi:hypothetical protein
MMLHGGDESFCLGPLSRGDVRLMLALMDGAAVFELHAVKKILHSSHFPRPVHCV